MSIRFGWNAIGKRSLSALLAPALMITSSFACASPRGETPAPVVIQTVREGPALSDIVGHWGQNAIEWAVSQGIVDGFADGTFKPDRPVSEAEFLTMLLRAYVGATTPQPGPGEPWYAGYYAFAADMRWPVAPSDADLPYKRGQVARLLAASQGQDLAEAQAVAYLLDNGLAQGKTGNTPEGFGAADTLTRAEAVQFIRNVQSKVQFVTGLPEQTRSFAVRGVALGDSEAAVLAKLGQPARQDPSEYGFDWYIYNQDYATYAQIGISDGKVVGLYTNARAWSSADPDIGADSAADDIVRAYGKPLDSLTKGFTRYLLNNPGVEDGVYAIDDGYVTFFYDTHENDALEAIQVIAKEVEEARAGYYPEPSEALRTAYEREVFDLANAARAKRGLTAFQWDDAAASTARKHSADMGETGYFDHTSPSGEGLQERFQADGIAYRSAAENIAAGQPDAITAHSGWLNSHTGHRESLLGKTERLGVGVYFGGPMHVYYTQNFYTPLK